MATFKIGQRVRVIKTYFCDHVLGMEGVIAPDGCEPPTPGWHNVFLNFPNEGGYDSWDRPGWQFRPEQLAPLTDPKADEFIARLEKLGREPVGVPAVELVKVPK